MFKTYKCVYIYGYRTTLLTYILQPSILVVYKICLYTQRNLSSDDMPCKEED